MIGHYETVEAGGTRVPRTSDPLPDPLFQGSSMARHLTYIARALTTPTLTA